MPVILPQTLMHFKVVSRSRSKKLSVNVHAEELTTARATVEPAMKLKHVKTAALLQLYVCIPEKKKTTVCFSNRRLQLEGVGIHEDFHNHFTSKSWGW